MAFLPLDPSSLTLDYSTADNLGKQLASTYQSAQPFHYICIDDFLPLDILSRVREDVLSRGHKPSENESDQEHLKTSFKPEALSLYTRLVFGFLNSPPFLAFLEQMTGINHLIPDPYYRGAGIHRTINGGYLRIHADFNFLKEMWLERRLNVLIYLNPDWKLEYGGAFEIWSKNMKECVARYEPIMNRMCCFSTSSSSYHGNPQPVAHPAGDPRLSIALYYYTATWSDGRVPHGTLFRPRQASKDKITYNHYRRLVLQELLPPVLYRNTRGIWRRLGF